MVHMFFLAIVLAVRGARTSILFHNTDVCTEADALEVAVGSDYYESQQLRDDLRCALKNGW